MNREQLAHVVRAAATITGDGDIVIIGSQAILGTADVDRLPEEATMSMEADVAFRNDVDASKADAVDGAIGVPVGDRIAERAFCAARDAKNVGDAMFGWLRGDSGRRATVTVRGSLVRRAICARQSDRSVVV